MNNYDEKLENEPVEIAEGIYWVGYSNDKSGLHCNPYLIIEGDEAVLIDGGSRDDFSNVMLKILRTGVEPSRISRLIYQHYDPDLCGSLPQLESIISNDSLRIISHYDNNIFINYYSNKTKKFDFRELDNHYDFATGRRLEFYATPFCHQPGSFITYDKLTKTLFSSDIFGSFDNNWSLFLELDSACIECTNTDSCLQSLPTCHIKDIKIFHQRVMASSLAAINSLNMIETLDVERIAPQHGSIINSRLEAKAIIRHLKSIKNVGIEYVLFGDKNG